MIRVEWLTGKQFAGPALRPQYLSDESTRFAITVSIAKWVDLSASVDGFYDRCRAESVDNPSEQNE